MKRRKNPLPRWMVAAGLLFLVASWIPLTLIARGRVGTSQEPRYQFMLDMAKQPRYGAEAASEVFADGRAMRPQVPGTVARGRLDEDDHYYRGFTVISDPQGGKPRVKWFEGFPSNVKITDELLARGQERFAIYCAACHGLDGYGDGPVSRRAADLGTPISAASFHTPIVRGRPDGHIFNTITNGIRNMPGYAAQIPVADRWAIVAYVRALQLSQDAPAKQ